MLGFHTKILKHQGNKRVFLGLCLVLMVRALLLGGYIAAGGLGLGPDEAQYWTWSQALDWGYYSKPPGIAWQIWSGCRFFGETELGVRAGSLLLGSLLPLAIYGLARYARLKREVAFWAGIIVAVSPMGVLAALLAITDVGLVLAWTVACYPLLRSVATHTPCRYWQVGLVIAAGALFKWPVYLLWLVILAVWPLFPVLRSFFSFLGGFLLSLLGLVPVLIWNYQHGWVTFRHVGTTMAGGHGAETGTTGLLHGNMLDFIGAQVILLSPLFFILLVLACLYVWHHRRCEGDVPDPVRLSCLATALLLSTYTAVALVQKMQGNWCIFAYPLAFLAIAWYGCERLKRGRLWLTLGAILALCLDIGALTLPWCLVPLRSHPFKYNAGWSNLSRALQQAGYQPGEHFLAADTYQTTSLLSFYGPEQQRAYFLNLHGLRHNQFTQWPGLADEQVGRDGFFAWIDIPRSQEGSDGRAQSYHEQLAPYFDHVHLLGSYPLVTCGEQPAKVLYLWYGTGYNGTTPVSRSLY